MKIIRRFVSVLLITLVASSCSRHATEVVVYYASSLTAVLSDAAEEFHRQNPRLRLRLEPSGSQVAVRKVTELGMRGDVVAVADAGLIPKMMIPSHASWTAVFAANEVVLAYKEHSQGTDEVTAQNWPEILTRASVRLGRADPNTAPIGYQTLMVWQLAEKSGLYPTVAAGLPERLTARCSNEHVVHDEAEVLSLLESRAIDYAFLFRSTAEDHHLKMLSLPAEINLSRADMADRYASAEVEIRMKQGQGTSRVKGSPVLYGITIPSNAPHPEAAVRFLQLLFGEEGRRLLAKRGFRPMLPAECRSCAALPAGLKSLVQSGS